MLHNINVLRMLAINNTAINGTCTYDYTVCVEEILFTSVDDDDDFRQCKKSPKSHKEDFYLCSKNAPFEEAKFKQ